jgi:hypothetical protein
MPRQIHQLEIRKNIMQDLSLAQTSYIVKAGIIFIITAFKALQTPANGMILLNHANPSPMLCKNISTFQTAKSASNY